MKITQIALISILVLSVYSTSSINPVHRQTATSTDLPIPTQEIISFPPEPLPDYTQAKYRNYEIGNVAYDLAYEQKYRRTYIDRDLREKFGYVFSDLHTPVFKVYRKFNETFALLTKPDQIKFRFREQVENDLFFKTIDRAAIWAQFEKYIDDCKAGTAARVFNQEYNARTWFHGASITHIRAWTTAVCIKKSPTKKQSISILTGAVEVTGDLREKEWYLPAHSRTSAWWREASRYVWDAAGFAYWATTKELCDCI